MDMITYEGRCHCGAVRFRVRSQLLVEGRRCNCSLCVRRGAVMSVPYFGPDAFELLAGREELAEYQFGDHMVIHHFCRTCGIYTFHEAVARPGQHRVNLGCLDGLDVLALAVEVIDGRSY